MPQLFKIRSGVALLASVYALLLVSPSSQAQEARTLVQRLLAQGRPGIGVQIRDVAAGDVAGDAKLNLRGAFVESVSAGSPAEKAGVAAGDIIVEFDGERIRSAEQLVRVVTETPAGREVSMVVIRSGKRIEMKVTPGDRWGDRNFTFEWPGGSGRSFSLRPPILRMPMPRPAPEPEAPQYVPPPGQPRPVPPFRFRDPAQLGIDVLELTPQLRDYFGVAQAGVLVSRVQPGSGAAKAGVKAGDVITAADGRVVRTADDLRRAVAAAKPGEQVTLSIVRDRKAITMKVRPDVGDRIPI